MVDWNSILLIYILPSSLALIIQLTPNLSVSIPKYIISEHTIFREILSNIPEKQKELLYAIAKEGEAGRITSAQFIKRHGLSSSSSVQSAMNKLLEKDIITEINMVFSVTDKLFALWINKIYGGIYLVT